MQGTVVVNERRREGPTSQALHHRRVDLKKVVCDKAVTDQLDQLGALTEGVAHLGVDEQVKVALAVADFDILQAVPFLRQGAQRFTQQAQGRGLDRELACAGAEEGAFDAYEVANIERFL